MDDRKVLRCYFGNSDVGDSVRGRWKHREECERKMAHSISKLRTMGPVPGIDGVELFQRRDTGPLDDAHQIQAGIGDSACAVGKTDQREHRTGSPDFGVIGAGGFERRQRKDDVADRAGTN
jgi:hypothetical protein